METKEIKYKRLVDDPDGMKYQLLEEYFYKSGMFNRSITIPEGRKSDGATGARDLGVAMTGLKGIWYRILARVFQTTSTKKTAAWFVHDELCLTGKWDDGTRISNFICSTVLSVILHNDGYNREAIWWWFATFFAGGGEARKNGLLWVHKNG